MQTKKLRKIVSWNSISAAVLFASVILPALIGIVANAPIASAATSSGKWTYSAAISCPVSDGTSVQITASLIYTDSLGKQSTYTCYKISILRGGAAQQMVLQGPTDKCNSPNVIRIPGGDPATLTGSYTNATKGEWDGLVNTGSGCASGGAIPFTVNPDYVHGSIAPLIAKGTWAAENPGKLNVTFLANIGNHKNGDTETFTESGIITNNLMTLLGSPADTQHCSNNPDSISIGQTQGALDDISGTLSTYYWGYSGSSLGCASTGGPVGLNSSYGSAGGKDDSSSTLSSGDKCPIDSTDGLRWILCPLFTSGMIAATGLNGLIANFLYVPTDQIFSPSTTGQKTTANFQTAFNVFRNIGISLLVIAGLVMVLSQASGLELFSAHAVRKALPRIVIAAIGMALAWPLLQFTITLFNDLGTWVGQIIITATNISPGSNGVGGSVGDVIVGVTGTIIALITAFVTLGGGWLLSLAGTILLAMFVGLVVLAIRQLVILLCVLLAPLAIAAAVLPGTEKLWHFWRDTLLGALVMFPIIMGFLSSGAAMASIAAAAGSKATSAGNQLSWDLLALLVCFAPYFLLPFAFRLASGLMGTIFGLVNDRHKGWFDKLSESRQNSAARTRQNLLAGQRFRGNPRFTGGINKLGGALGAALSTDDKLGLLTANGRREAMRQHRDLVNGEYAKRPKTAASMFHDKMLQAQTYSSAAEARANLARDFGMSEDDIKSSIAAANANGGFGMAQQTYAVQQLAATGTGYKNMDQMLRTVARVSGGNQSSINSWIGNMRSSAERSGRNDLKASFGTMTGIAGEMAGIMQKGGGAEVIDQSITSQLSTKIEDAVVDAGLGVDNASLWRNKTPSVTNITDALTKSLDRQMKVLRQPGIDPNSDAYKAASEAAGAITAKLGNMDQSAQYGYGPEANVKASWKVTTADNNPQVINYANNEISFKKGERPRNPGMQEVHQALRQNRRQDDQDRFAGGGNGPEEQH